MKRHIELAAIKSPQNLIIFYPGIKPPHWLIYPQLFLEIMIKLNYSYTSSLIVSWSIDRSINDRRAFVTKSEEVACPNESLSLFSFLLSSRTTAPPPVHLSLGQSNACLALVHNNKSVRQSRRDIFNGFNNNDYGLNDQQTVIYHLQIQLIVIATSRCYLSLLLSLSALIPEKWLVHQT